MYFGNCENHKELHDAFNRFLIIETGFGIKDWEAGKAKSPYDIYEERPQYDTLAIKMREALYEAWNLTYKFKKEYEQKSIKLPLVPSIREGFVSLMPYCRYCDIIIQKKPSQRNMITPICREVAPKYYKLTTKQEKTQMVTDIKKQLDEKYQTEIPRSEITGAFSRIKKKSKKAKTRQSKK